MEINVLKTNEIKCYLPRLWEMAYANMTNEDKYRFLLQHSSHVKISTIDTEIKITITEVARG